MCCLSFERALWSGGWRIAKQQRHYIRAHHNVIKWKPYDCTSVWVNKMWSMRPNGNEFSTQFNWYQYLTLAPRHIRKANIGFGLVIVGVLNTHSNFHTKINNIWLLNGGMLCMHVSGQESGSGMNVRAMWVNGIVIKCLIINYVNYNNLDQFSHEFMAGANSAYSHQRPTI